MTSTVVDDDVFKEIDEDDFCHIEMEITCINEDVADQLMEDLETNSEDEDEIYYMRMRYDTILNRKPDDPKVIIFGSHKFYGEAMEAFKKLLINVYPNTEVRIKRFGYFRT